MHYAYVVLVSRRMDVSVVVFQVRLLILSPITDPTLELVIVMFIVPFIVNVSSEHCCVGCICCGKNAPVDMWYNTICKYFTKANKKPVKEH